MKRTKILATLGPASNTKEKVQQLYEAGANGFRINMSHGDREGWKQIMDVVKEVAPEALIVADTRGPELRILNVGEIHLEAEQEFTFSLVETQDKPYVSNTIDMQEGHRILFDDGAISTVVVHRNNTDITVKIEAGGILTDRRKVTVPDDMVNLPVLDESDIEDIIFCKAHGAGAVALSFTQCERDIATCRAVVGEDIMIIAKIENRTGVEHHDQIIGAADAVMVARGDLGVEIPLEEVPGVQKMICKCANVLGKPVVVATQMLESMKNANTPTRAEVSDVANAILDGADCVMLSAETAVGNYPYETVKIMSRIAKKADDQVHPTFPHDPEERLSVGDAISYGVYDMSTHLDVQAIVTATASGHTSKNVARFRPHVPIIAVTYSDIVMKQLQLTWGVQPCLCPHIAQSGQETIIESVRAAMKKNYLREEDTIIATAGIATLEKGTTNLIQVHDVKDLLAYYDQK